MKLATYRDGSRDGQLVVVSRDLVTAHFVTGIASRLQQVLDDWNFLSPQLEDLYATLNDGKARHAFAFEPARCMAPLPRAPGVSAWWEGGDVAMPLAARSLAGPADGAARFAALRAATHVTTRVGLGALTGDLDANADRHSGSDAIRLVTIAIAWTPRDAAGETAVLLGPVAVTPDELGAPWQHGRLQRPLTLRLAPGAPPEAVALPFDFGAIASASAARLGLGAGHLVLGLGAPASAESAGDPGLATPVTGAALEWIGPDGRSAFGTLTAHAPGAAR